MMVHGVAPRNHIDHRDGDGTNNRLENIRECTHSQNMQNRAGLKQGRLKGVSKIKNKWEASIRSGGRAIHLGRFATEAKAHAAYCAAAAKYHGDFARTS